MSMDKGLKARSTLSRHRNVLKRDERIDMLKDAEKWGGEQSVLGLPKVGHRKVVVKKVKATPAAGAETAVAGAEGEAVPAAGAAAPAAKGTAGAKSAAAAPAAKAPAGKK